MILKRILPLLMLAAAATALPAQTPARAHQLADEFSKRKDAVKHKHGVTVRKFHEVVSEAWLASPSGYAGVYFAESPGAEIRVAGNGSVTGAGFDGGRFTLRDARIADGLLTATKVYANGRTEPFEAVFLKRSDRGSPNADFTVNYGLGFFADGHDYGTTSPLRVFAVRQ